MKIKNVIVYNKTPTKISLHFILQALKQIYFLIGLIGFKSTLVREPRE